MQGTGRRIGDDQGTVRLLNMGLTDWQATQATYHAIAECMQADSPDTLILCRPRQPYACLGYHQVYDAALDRRECARRRLPVFRRRLGGGATYLDADQLFYQCVFHHTRVPVLLADTYQRMLAAPVAALRRLGLNAALRDINEIEVDGRRIAGTGGGRIGEACVVVGNVLFDFDYNALSRVWRVPWESFRELAGGALRDCITTLRRLGGAFSPQAVETILLEEFRATLGRPLEPGALTPHEKRRSREIAFHNMSEPYLNLHREDGVVAPMDSLKISAGVFIRARELQAQGRRIRASFRLREETIEESRLESFPARSWQSVELALKGAPFNLWQRELQRLAN